jgi:anti-sigma B factor antagonist
MADEVPGAGSGQQATTVIVLPAEIDCTNGQEVLERLLAAFQPGVSTVVVDMLATRFCDSAGLARIIMANRVAAARQVELRIAATAGTVLKIFEVTGLDTLVPVYPSVAGALAAAPRR